jgi:hypothetical protein
MRERKEDDYQPHGHALPRSLAGTLLPGWRPLSDHSMPVDSSIINVM